MEDLISDYQLSRISDISGAKGGKGGGGGRTPIEANDTLSSKQTLRLLFLLSQGEVDSVQDILVNGVSYTQYSGITVDFRPGTLDQTVIPGFSEVEAPLAGTFPIQLKNAIPTHVEYVGSIPGDISAARITLMTDMLRVVTPEGDRVGYSVSADIYVRPSASAGWTLVTSTTKSGKCSNPYAWDIRVQRPATTNPLTDTWGIRVIRTSPDDADDRHYSKLYVTQVVKITESSLTYPGKALVGVTVRDASQFNGQVPEIRFRMRGIKMLLPINYSPVDRSYNEATPWNGAFKTIAEYTDNLSWAIYYSLTHPTWGLKIPSTDVDIGSFYLFAKYCDQLVSDGAGGLEPRYRIDVQFIERENTPTYLTYLKSLGNADLVPNEFGQVSVVWDGSGQAITKLESNATVIDGEFHYSSNSSEERVTLVTATYSSRLLQGDTDTAMFKEDSLVPRYGLQTSDIVHVGCVRESQAVRKCRWAIWVNAYDTEIISFKKLFAGIPYKKGEVVSMMDSENRDDISHHAVVNSVTIVSGNTQFHLDRSVTLSNNAYTIQYIILGGVVEENVPIFESNGDFSTITISGVVTHISDFSILFSKAGFTPRLAKVIGVEKEDNVYTITCSSHDENKYAYVDGIGTLPIRDTSGSFVNFSKFSAPAPTNLTFEEVFSSNGVTTGSHIAVKWQWDEAGTLNFKPVFKFEYRRDKNSSIVANGITVKSFDIPDPVPGVYEVFVWAINPFSGLASTVLTGAYNFRINPATSTLIAPINLYVSGTIGGIFSDKNLALTWENPTANYSKPDKLRDYIVEIRDYNSPFDVKKTYIVTPEPSQNGRFTFSFSENVSVFGVPTRQFRVRVYCRDLVGDTSPGIELVCYNPAPSHTNLSFSVASDLNAARFIISQTVAELDVVGYKVWQGTSAGFAKNAASLKYSGPDPYPIIKAEYNNGNPYYYAVAAYDTFGDNDLDISSEQTSTPLSLNTDTWTKTGLDFTANAGTNTISWTAGTITRNGTTSWNISAGSQAWSGGVVYIYFKPIVSTTTLLATQTLGIAVGVGCWPIATYVGGGNTGIKGGTGSAFFSGSEIIGGSIGAAQLVTGSAVITGAAQIAAAIIQEAHLGTAVIVTGHIRDANITTAKIADANITTTKIVNASITEAKIQNLAVTSTKIAYAAIQTAHIGEAQVDTLSVAGNAITVPLAVFSGTLEDSITLTIPVASTTVTANIYVSFGGLSTLGTNSDIPIHSASCTATLSSSLGTHYSAEVHSMTMPAGIYTQSHAWAAGVLISLPANTSIILTLTLTGSGDVFYNHNRFISVVTTKR